ncbi:MAG: LacI family DNA-binding transcriptional regulator [Betaproteobacteria bacterium]|nr:LacI family DNA-binding transcriptional regulator [Betaproteobacteria bacterium]
MSVTLESIARRVGVDVSLVSRVLRGDPQARISDEKRKKILSIARNTNYLPNRMARSLRTRRTKILAMLTPDITNPFHSFLFRAVERTASAAGYDVILCNTDDSADRFKKVVTTLAEGHVDGLLIATARHVDPAIDWLRERGLPYVLINRRRSGNTDPWIGPDDQRTGWLGGHHLAGLGHRRIAFLMGRSEIGNMGLREAGYRAALAELDCPVAEDLIFRDLTDRRSGYDCAQALLALPRDSRPTALFSVHSVPLDGAMIGIQKAGLKVPDDLSLVGYSASNDPDLTSVCIPAEEMARAATQHLLERLSGEKAAGEGVLNTTLPVELIDRGTSQATRSFKA